MNGTQLVLNSAVDYEQLENKNLEVTLRVTDAAGLSFDKTFQIVVNNVNDAPILVNTLADIIVDEDTPIDIDLAGAFTDVDGDALVLTADAPAWLSIVNGRLVGQPPANFNGELDITIMASDGMAMAQDTFKLTVVPVNDAPQLAVSNTSPIIDENALFFRLLTLFGTDVDTPPAGLSYLISGGANSDKFSINGNGLAMNDFLDYETAAVDSNGNRFYEVKVQAFDGELYSNEVTIKVIVRDINEAPTALILSNVVSSIPEDNVNRVKLADISYSDDALGDETIDVFGFDSAFFEIDGSALYLKAGVALDYELFPVLQTFVRVIDPQAGGVASLFQLNVSDVNEAGEIVGTRFGNVTEDSILSASAKLTVLDPDAGQALFQVANQQGLYGEFNIDANGNWTYNLNNAAAQSLKGGEQKVETFTVTSLDGTDSEVVTININGANDAAVIGGALTGVVRESVDLFDSGTLTITDIDTGEAAFQAKTVNSTYGTFTIDSSGNWTYNLNNNNPAVAALNNNQSLVDTISVASLDGTVADVNVIIQGTTQNQALVYTTGDILRATANGQILDGSSLLSPAETLVSDGFAVTLKPGSNDQILMQFHHNDQYSFENNGAGRFIDLSGSGGNLNLLANGDSFVGAIKPKTINFDYDDSPGAGLDPDGQLVGIYTTNATAIEYGLIAALIPNDIFNLILLSLSVPALRSFHSDDFNADVASGNYAGTIDSYLYDMGYIIAPQFKVNITLDDGIDTVFNNTAENRINVYTNDEFAITVTNNASTKPIYIYDNGGDTQLITQDGVISNDVVTFNVLDNTFARYANSANIILDQDYLFTNNFDGGDGFDSLVIDLTGLDAILRNDFLTKFNALGDVTNSDALFTITNRFDPFYSDSPILTVIGEEVIPTPFILGGQPGQVTNVNINQYSGNAMLRYHISFQDFESVTFIG